ncbi:septal ring lytic transglycosylase RlpA family protein [Cellvibrio mixtus]|uniref:septal ring lytic transglycosylase RlpA family protein n=1 Tax=Cellvibrio mixtus TaxID=39650 RepID=UPI0005867A6D|nr:septal ring lytic transglycosylase RlpA family protein [Cellvibrio mixtus]
MRFVVKTLVAILISAFMWGCSSMKPVDPSAQSTATRDRPSYTETGKASFYANLHQAKKTASGEIYDHKLNTAAHKNLPFGTKVRVTNLANGKTVIVKINDRGPFIRGRILDLSKSAFSSIASVSSGIIEVKIEVIE